MVLVHQDVHNLRQSIWLHGHLNTSKVLCARDPLEWWTQSGVGALWTNCPHAANNVCRVLWTSAPGWLFLATRSIPATKTGYSHALDGTHSKWQHSVPWGPWRVGDLQFYLWALSIGTRVPDELWSFVNSVGSVCLLHWRCVLSEVSLDLSASVSSAGQTLHSTLDPLSWALAQLVTYISTNGWPAVTHTSCSKCWLPSTMAGLWTLAQCVIPKATPLSKDFTVSRSSQVVTQLSASVNVLSHPFWYPNSKLNCTRALTHWWPMESRLGVDIMYISRLLSVCTTNDW